ncbi:(2E,6E)-farnesyl diphosphate synthase [hydrothermal vent metagenome]|uniref:(2E,6E)-farnesyl diphosphate synthase n=1 Tax=hydrothermal vent metagenome TaxID=652676 RepID=A0A3B0SHZ7_9ZZZZ
MPANNNLDLAKEMESVARAIDKQFGHILTVPDDPRAELFEAMRHATIGGGKRLRPLLVMATARLHNVEENSALNAATAVEALHVYSLIHDDLPCMDDDALRRGKPTVHKAFGEAQAVLAGDALHALAFELLADEKTHRDPFVRAEMVASLAKAAGSSGMAGGQMMDLVAEKQTFDLQTVTRLQQLKTGALVSVCTEIGAILGRVPVEGRTGLRGYAHDLGLAFQIADDILDVEGDEALAGKLLHKDEAAGKQTFLSLMGLERAKEQAQMLVNQAKSHLNGYGEEADLLRAIAEYVVHRDR